MRKVWVLDTETKGTGAQMVPLDKVLKEPARDDKAGGRSRRPRRRAAAEPGRESAAQGRRGKRARRAEASRTPLPPGHVRKTATGEIGRVRSVDARAGTASVLWLRQGHTSTVPLSAISRR